MMSDLGNLTIEDAMRLTFRQVACLWERYLHKQQWNLKMQIDLNPFLTRKKKGSQDPSSRETEGTVTGIDATSDDGIAQMIASGLPVKIRKQKAVPEESKP